MNMPKRPDEQLLWDSFPEPYRTPREAGQALGINGMRVAYLCSKWSRNKIYNYGVTVDLGWKEGELNG